VVIFGVLQLTSLRYHCDFQGIVSKPTLHREFTGCLRQTATLGNRLDLDSIPKEITGSLPWNHVQAMRRTDHPFFQLPSSVLPMHIDSSVGWRTFPSEQKVPRTFVGLLLVAVSVALFANTTSRYRDSSSPSARQVALDSKTDTVQRPVSEGWCSVSVDAGEAINLMALGI
jgi:hypothetical protein